MSWIYIIKRRIYGLSREFANYINTIFFFIEEEIFSKKIENNIFIEVEEEVCYLDLMKSTPINISNLRMSIYVIVIVSSTCL